MKKILILTSGLVKKLDGFVDASKDTEMEVHLGSFYDISYDSNYGKVRFQEHDLADYDLLYFRLVGKSLETAALVSEYAKSKGIKLVDDVYETSHVLVTSVSKYLEYYRLADKVNIPPTYFARVSRIRRLCGTKLGYPYIVKSTSGRKARDVWYIDKSREEEVFTELRSREMRGDKFFAQVYIPSSTRIRILVVGDRAIAGIIQPSKYVKIVKEGITDMEREALKSGFTDVPAKLSEIALKAARAVDLNISGVDILRDEKSGKLYVIEANAAPAWKLINKYCDISVETEILKYLAEIKR